MTDRPGDRITYPGAQSFEENNNIRLNIGEADGASHRSLQNMAETDASQRHQHQTTQRASSGSNAVAS